MWPDGRRGTRQRRLEGAGTAAAALADEQLAARDRFREIHMPTVGTHRYPGYLFKMRNTPDDVRLPPPLLGEHNEEVYLDVLGYSRDEYDALVAKGLVGTTYPPQVLPQVLPQVQPPVTVTLCRAIVPSDEADPDSDHSGSTLEAQPPRTPSCVHRY